MLDFYERLQEGRYGSFELKRHVGPNLIRGLVLSLALHVVFIGVPWLIFLLHQKPTPELQARVIPRLDYTLRSEMEKPQTEPQKRKSQSAEESGGGGGGEETHEMRGTRRSYPRLERSSDLNPGGVEGVSFDVLDAHVRAARPGEAETPIGERIAARTSSRRGAGVGRIGNGVDDDGIGGADDFGGGLGLGGGIGGGNGPRNGLGSGPGLGDGHGDVRGNGGGRGRGSDGGSGDAGDDGGDLQAFAPAPPAPGAIAGDKPKFDVVSVRPNRGAIISKADRSPVVDWIERHQKPIPVTLGKPEILNRRSGDVTAWTEFDDEQGRHYTLYLLGRNSHPPQLNIFLVSGGKGTLLQDEGAKGESEVYKFGTASGDPRNPTVQLEQLPPGRPEAKQMMAVFTAWWNHIKSTGT